MRGNVMMELIKVRELADARFAWPGGYEMFGVTHDGDVLCCPCIVENWAEVADDEYGNAGWAVVGFGHDGELDEPVGCDHCNRQIGGE